MGRYLWNAGDAVMHLVAVVETVRYLTADSLWWLFWAALLMAYLVCDQYAIRLWAERHITIDQ